MKKLDWRISFSLVLVIVSAIVYVLQIIMFRKPVDTAFYLFQDIAFLPIYVIIVTLMIDAVLRGREQEALMNKMNMVIGVFFSECGNALIKEYREFDENGGNTKELLSIDMKWTEKDLGSLQKTIRTRQFDIKCSRGDVTRMREFLMSKRDFLLRLLENPNLLEHDTFTDLLMAVFHIAEELEMRRDLKAVCGPDSEHISNDMKRAFSLLVYEWLSYMKHLKREFPYLYSLSIRMNPFDPDAKAEIS